MIQFEEYKVKLNDLKPKLEELRAAFLPQSVLDELERRPFTTAFVDGEGNIVSDLIVGGRSYEDWKEIIDSLMA